MTRPGDERVLLIDFDGLDGAGNLVPLAQSYACRVRDTEQSLYFSRRGERGSNAREHWHAQLDAFVTGLN